MTNQSEEKKKEKARNEKANLSESQQEQAEAVVLSDGGEREGNGDLSRRGVDLEKNADGDFVRRHREISRRLQNRRHQSLFTCLP